MVAIPQWREAMERRIYTSGCYLYCLRDTRPTEENGRKRGMGKVGCGKERRNRVEAVKVVEKVVVKVWVVEVW